MSVKTSKSYSAETFRSGFEPDKTNGVSVLSASKGKKVTLKTSAIGKVQVEPSGSQTKTSRHP